jgi:hypothetical protein
MPETGSNIELAHTIHEHGHHHASPSYPHAEWVGIAEAVVLAIVAVATAWSGYQASKWDAQSARNYAYASRTNVQSQEKATLAGQDRLYDIVTFNGWIAAKTANNQKLVEYYERRFRPEYKTAFEAWQRLDPFNNPTAPAGPIFMAEYKNGNEAESARLSEEVSRYFEKGVYDRETGDRYVKVTVLLATALLLTALSQRFDIFGPRVAVVVVALGLLGISAYSLLSLPRL